jgi:hypothetical protein
MRHYDDVSCFSDALTLGVLQLRMWSTSQVTNCDLFFCKTGKGVSLVRNVWDIDQTPVKPFMRHSGQIREMLENVRQPLPRHMYGGLS